jgi:hypothetical protein
MTKPDDLSSRLDLLTRREVEARLLAPVLAAFTKEFGEARVRAVLADAVADLAREHGAALAARLGGNGMAELARSTSDWTAGGALEIELVEQSPEVYAFNATRCRYAEMYEALGLRELGATLSCARDAALLAGFNPEMTLTRTQTIMEGAPHCDFVYRWKRPET